MSSLAPDLCCRCCRFPLRQDHCDRGECGHRTHCSCDPEETGRRLETRVIGEHDGLGITRHALQRYWERTEGVRPSVRFEDAWDAAVPVGSPDVRARLLRYYPPDDVLFLVNGDEFKTVLPAISKRLTTGHLVECECCGEPWDPVRSDGCPWCPGCDDGDDFVPIGAVARPPPRPRDDLEAHECPSCGRDTYGAADDDRCKACRLTAQEADDEEEQCAADGCWETPDGDYCEFHVFMEAL